MTQKGMQKLLSFFLFLLFPFQLLSADYDAFILNFLRVTPTENTLFIDMSLGTPKTISLEKTLQKGHVLKFSVEISLIRERIFKNKTITTHIKEYYLQYEPLARQFMISELLENTQTITNTNSLSKNTQENNMQTKYNTQNIQELQSNGHSTNEYLHTQNHFMESATINTVEETPQWKILLRNSDPHYLLETLISHLHFKIPTVLEHNNHYKIEISTKIKEAASKKQRTFLFLEENIIQPAQFTYEFDF